MRNPGVAYWLNNVPLRPNRRAVHAILRSCSPLLLVCALGSIAGSAEESQAWGSAVVRAALAMPEARLLVVDFTSGKVLASHRLKEAAGTLAFPGSTLKPLVLYQALAAGRWNGEQRVPCDGRLRVAGHTLACSHPRAEPMDARAALAWSCNRYFAAVAAAMPPHQLRPLLAQTGLLGLTGLGEAELRRAGKDEARAEYREPRSADELRLSVLGVEGIRVTPLELAAAYRWLGQQFALHPSAAATQVVAGGLEDSVNFGMAGAANVGGVRVAGKTGTASSQMGGQTHGWFVGLAPADAPRVVIAIYLPAARGADAARLAASLLAASPLSKP